MGVIIYLIRHGQHEGPGSEAGLTVAGRKQVMVLALPTPTYIYTSHFADCIESAQLLSRKYEKTYVIHEELDPIDVVNGESPFLAEQRVMGFLFYLADIQDDALIFCVTHDEIMNLVLKGLHQKERELLPGDFIKLKYVGNHFEVA